MTDKFSAHLVRITRPNGEVTTLHGPMIVEVYARYITNEGEEVFPSWTIGKW